MKKTIFTLSLTAIVAGGVLTTSAADYKIEYVPNVILLPGTSVTGEFNLLTETSYNPSVEGIVGADVEFFLYDSGSGPEKVVITLEGNWFAEASNFFVWGAGGPGSGFNLSLLDDGVLGYEVTSEAGGTPVVFYSAKLIATTGLKAPPGSTAVPDGGATLGLLGLGLLAVAGMSRRVVSA